MIRVLRHCEVVEVEHMVQMQMEGMPSGWIVYRSFGVVDQEVRLGMFDIAYEK